MNRCRMILRGYRFARFSRFLSRMIGRWPLFILLFLVLSPTTPHLLLRDRPCTYVSVRGIITAPQLSQCPWLIIVNTKTWEAR